MIQRLTKINQFLIFVLLVGAILYFGSRFLIPLIMGLLFASLVMPLAKRMERAGANRILSSFISTSLVLIVSGALIGVFAYQIDHFASDINTFHAAFLQSLNNLQDRIANITDISIEDQMAMWQERSGDFAVWLESFVTRLIGNMFHALLIFLLILIYTYLFLFYRDKIYDFLLMYIRRLKLEDPEQILYDINKVVFYYLWGRFQVMLLLGVLFYITFIIFGLPYAVLITIISGLITIIPYLGPFISGLLPILFAFVFFESFEKALFFSGIIIVIQLVESYVFEPLIIGKEVRLSPLVVFATVIGGGVMWGPIGMVVFVPLVAMFTIVARHTPELKPVGFLLGRARTEADHKEQVKTGADKPIPDPGKKVDQKADKDVENTEEDKGAKEERGEG